MKRWFPILFLLTFVVFVEAQEKMDIQIKTERDFVNAPSVKKIPAEFVEFGNIRVDNYFWLKEKSNPEVIAYLEAENQYTETVLSHTAELQAKIFEELKSRIKEDDISVPYFDNGYFYQTKNEKGKDYPVFIRKKGSLDSVEEIIFDVNKMAENQPAFLFRNFNFSKNNKLVAYAFNTNGSYAEFTLRVKDIESGNELDVNIEKISSFVWSNDNKTIYYTTSNEALRPYRVYKYEICSQKAAELLFEEKDELFNLRLSKDKSNQYIFIISSSFTSSEYRLLDADKPAKEATIFLERQPGFEYYLYPYQNDFYILVKNDDYFNYKVFKTSKDNTDRKNWATFIEHDENVKIESIELFKDKFVYMIRKNGLREIKIFDFNSGETSEVLFPEPVYAVSMGYTPEFNTESLRYIYRSLNRPATTFEYNMNTGISEILKVQEIPGGFKSDDYIVERLWATATDGKKVPMAVIYKKGLKKDGSNPALLYAYGSYGATTEANFNSNVFSLIDRGFVYGIAQIRGGSELGEKWYDDGKLKNKMNTFTDFISCSEYLIEQGYTKPEKLSIMGGSAGGLLMGVVVNLRPDLFGAVIAAVPFVDVVNTMLDASLPLTTQEYEQWGNPNIEEDYKYILSYSPYDNITEQIYPNILATGGLHDSQVLFHEPAKWVAKLRDYKLGDNLILLKTNMESGHGGATGRFTRLKEVAFEYAFILDRFGIIK